MPTDRFGRVIAVAQVLATLAAVAATIVAVLLSARLLSVEKKSEVRETAEAVKRAYAVRLRAVARGVEDMVKCKEKLRPYATGDGTRLSFSDLKLLSGTDLSSRQLEAIQSASDELDLLFEPPYTFPPSGTDAAYQAWHTGRVRTRAIAANSYMRKALRALGTTELTPNQCYGEEAKRRASRRLRRRIKIEHR